MTGVRPFLVGATGMDDRTHPVARFSHFLHRNFIWFVLASYAVAAVAPEVGRWMRDVSFGDVSFAGERVRLSLPVLMLAWLLFNAGLGVRTSRLKQLLRRPLPLLAGLAGNLLIPVAYIFGVTQLMRLWHNPDEVQNILVGLALVASMPIAGSSTAWSQNANGDLGLSLGLVLFSTLLSPLTTPAALYSVGLMAKGVYAERLHELAAYGTGPFLALFVLLPSLLGILVRPVIGKERVAAAAPTLKLVNSINLLLLNYSNASVSLPETIANPDPDFLMVTLGIVVVLCLLAFATGWLTARWVRADRAQTTALMFGLGMNNNGTGMVLASLTLADHPRVMLPIIFSNLVQHLVAGAVDFALSHSAAAQGEGPGEPAASAAA
jgi:BASS family bile acid:Na+ symporter